MRARFTLRWGADMWQKLIKSSAGAFLSTVPVGYYLILFTLAGVLCGGYFNGLRWQHKYDALVNKQQSAVLDAQAKADEQTKANATATAQLDTNYYKEYQNASKNADYWRNRALTERVSNQANCANNATHSTSGGVGDDTAITAIDNRPLDVQSTAIIELSTIAAQMRAQVEYLQAKHLADVRTVNNH